MNFHDGIQIETCRMIYAGGNLVFYTKKIKIKSSAWQAKRAIPGLYVDIQHTLLRFDETMG